MSADLTLDDIASDLSAAIRRSDWNDQLDALNALWHYAHTARIGTAPAEALAELVGTETGVCAGDRCHTPLYPWAEVEIVGSLATCGSPQCVADVSGSLDEARQQVWGMVADPCAGCDGPLPSHGFVAKAGLKYCRQACAAAAPVAVRA